MRGARLDAHLVEAPQGTSLDGAPAHARTYVSADLRAAVWGPDRIGGQDTWVLVETPAGRGGAWLGGVLNQSLAMQLGGVRAAVGEHQVTLRRNGPRLRLRDRVVRAEGDGGAWTFRSRGAAGAAWRRADGTIIWERVDQRRTVTTDATPDEIAFAVLTDHALIETGLSALSFLQGL